MINASGVTAAAFTGNLIGGTVSATTGNFSGTCVVATPTLAGHATTKSYVDGLVANSVTFSTNFSVAGTTFVGGSEFSFYTRKGNSVQLTDVNSCTSSSGTASDIRLDLPFPSAYNQFSVITSSASLASPGAGQRYIARLYPSQTFTLVILQDSGTYVVTTGSNGGASGSARTYIIQVDYICQ